MRHWQMAQQGLKSLFLVALILASCAAPGSDNPEEGCGGTEASVSCLDIINIVPTSSNTGNTNNVDAFIHVCEVNQETGEITAVESIFDHNAQVTFANTRFPTASGTFDIRITGYSVAYRLNNCPRNAIGCPPLPGFTVQENILVPADSQVTRALAFVPLRVKDAYVAAGGERSIPAPSYSAVYVFTAQTTRFNDTFTVEARAEFTITDFDTCTQ